MSIPQVEGPICDAINARFDAWNDQIENLKNQTREAIERQKKKIEDDINDYVDKKTEEYKQDEGTELPTTIDIPSSIENALNSIQASIKWINKAIEATILTMEDMAAAPVVLADRSAETLDKLAEL